MSCELLIIVILVICILIGGSCACNHRYYYKTDKFTNNFGCKNIPPNFKHGYSQLPNQYYIAPLEGYPLGANSTMVVHGLGSCSSNVNDVTDLDTKEKLIKYCSRSTKDNQNNFFNV